MILKDKNNERLLGTVCRKKFRKLTKKLEAILTVYQYSPISPYDWMPGVWGAILYDVNPEEVYQKELKIVRATGNELKRLVKAGFTGMVIDYLWK